MSVGKHVLVAMFPDEAEADTVAQSLKEWDRLDDEVKLNAIGVLVLADDIVAGAVSDKLTGPGGELPVLQPTDDAVAEVDPAEPLASS